MPVTPEYAAFIADMLESWSPVSIRRMFGGAGVHRDGLMFALIVDDTLYFKADDETRPRFIAAGAPPFSYAARGRTATLSYYRCPELAIDDPQRLVEWAEAAFAAAVRAGAGKPRGGARRRHK